MESGKDSQVWQFKWHIAIIVVVVGGVIAVSLFRRPVEKIEGVWLFALVAGGLIFLVALLVMLSRVSRIVSTLNENSSRLEEASKALEGIRDGLLQINHSTRISEAAKAIAFREDDKRSLRETVFERLKQNDFDGAYEIVDEIENHSEYRLLAEELRRQVDNYRNATQDERIDQAIAQVEKLFDACQWVKASLQIESLIRANPGSEKLKALRQKLVERKEERKRILLAAWDDAVTRQETDRSLEILRELDMYLTPNEALALQEAAKDVFRTKLHNLGVQFALAVSDRHWSNALEIGQQIVRDFPNSRMSVEIREKLHVLRQNVELQTN
jgi:energy-converting hydrogenase Eha subunit C